MSNRFFSLIQLSKTQVPLNHQNTSFLPWFYMYFFLKWIKWFCVKSNGWIFVILSPTHKMSCLPIVLSQCLNYDIYTNTKKGRGPCDMLLYDISWYSSVYSCYNWSLIDVIHVPKSWYWCPQLMMLNTIQLCSIPLRDLLSKGWK